MNDTATLQSRFERIQRQALIVGAIGIIISIIGVVIDRAQFFHSYLFGYLFWAGLTLGCFAIMMLHYLAQSSWGFPIQRLVEAGARTLPLLAVLFVPLALGLSEIYVWARPDVVAQDPLLQHKAPYLNVPFFVGRAVLYFVVWIVLVYKLNDWSMTLDEEENGVVLAKLRQFSAIGLVVFTLTVTFALIDWAMSLEPKWWSTVYSAMLAMGEILGAFAFVIVLVILLREHEPLSGLLSPRILNDLGSLLLAFVMLWAYLSFSQLLIIWSGNLSEEIPWYVRRLHGGWQWFGLIIILLHFFLPFLLLVSRDLKRDGRKLAGVAAFLIVMHLIETFWLIEPAFYQGRFHIHWLDFAVFIGIGGLWIAAFVWQLKSRSLVPAQAIRRAEEQRRRGAEAQRRGGAGGASPPDLRASAQNAERS